MQQPGRSRAFPRPLLLAVLAVLVATSAADATTVLRLSEEELIDNSPLVVVGTCRSTATVHAGGRLLTHAEIEVEQALKGHSRRRLTIVLPGGVDRDAVPPVAEVWAGAPTLVVGERAVLFLRPTAERGSWSLVGFAQGKLTLAASSDDGALAALTTRVRRRAAGTASIVDGEVAP